MDKKSLEEMSEKEKEDCLSRLWKKVNFVSLFEEINWELREPKCACDFCDQIYNVWVKEGRIIYSHNKSNIDFYEEIIRKANIRRKEMKGGEYC